ncbi:MAG: transglutaminaseTgpA domain-containing protein [Actinomycetota bacterium]
MALLAYGQIFVNGEYLGPAFLGLLFAAGITVMSRRLGIGTTGTIAVSLAGLVWYLVLVFQARHSFFGLPTLEALERIATSVGRAYDHIEVDYEPVPVRNGYAVLIVVGIWLATVIGEIAAFRWRRPLLASLAPLGLFSIAIVVADREGAPMLVALFLSSLLLYWGLESSHSLRSWGRWIPTWSDREEEPPAVTGRLARRMAASCVAAALVAPIVLPALDEGVLAWRSGGGDGPEAGGGRVDHLVSIKPTLLEQSTTDLFHVRADSPAYWRLVSLTAFDGESWYPGASPANPVGGGFIEAPDVVEIASTTISQDYRISGLEGEFLPAAVAPYTITFDTDDPTEDLERVRSGGASGELSYDGGIDSEIRYRVDSLAPDVSYRTLTHAVPGQGPGAEAYTALPDDLAPEVAALAREWTRAADSPAEKLIAIQKRLRQFTYKVDVEPEDSSDYLVDFLTKTRAGYCQQFATAFAVLARSLGFPARVSVGFLPGETDPATPDSYVVRGTDAHAWPEVAFQEVGWVAFEPTPRSEAPPLAHTLRNPVGLIGATEGTLGDPREGRAAGPSDKRLGEFPFDPPFSEADDAVPAPPSTPAWTRAFPRFAAVVAVLVIVFLVSVSILKTQRARRRFRRAHTPRATAAAAFAQFLDDAGELATPRAASETPRAYATRIAAQRQLVRTEALRLADLYEASIYAAWEISRPQADEARKLANRMRARLWASASWWERAARLFSPAGLRPSAGRL